MGWTKAMLVVIAAIGCEACMTDPGMYGGSIRELRSRLALTPMPAAAQTVLDTECPKDPDSRIPYVRWARCFSTVNTILVLHPARNLLTNLLAERPDLLRIGSALARSSVELARFNENTWSIAIESAVSHQNPSWAAEELGLIRALISAYAVDDLLARTGDVLLRLAKVDGQSSARPFAVEAVLLAGLATNPEGSLLSYRESIARSADAFARARIEVRLDHSTPAATQDSASAPPPVPEAVPSLIPQ